MFTCFLDSLSGSVFPPLRNEAISSEVREASLDAEAVLAHLVATLLAHPVDAQPEQLAVGAAERAQTAGHKLSAAVPDESCDPALGAVGRDHRDAADVR